jgi:aryl carrier-like protein
VWGQLLGIDQVGIHDNFFELGGDSLRGIQAAARARREGVELTTQLLFQHPTIADLAARLEEPPAAVAPSAGLVVPGSSGPGADRLAEDLTPEHFPHARLDQSDLDELLAAFGESEE